MTTRAQLRKTALAFPEVEEITMDNAIKFAVRRKEFVSLSKEGIVRLRLPDAEVEDALAAYASAERLFHAGRQIGIQAPLTDVGGQHLWYLARIAWLHCAPKRLAAKFTAIMESPTQPGSDLPSSIGNVATRELATAGLTTLDQVATRTKAELLAIHGVGPKAVRILEETLAENGMSLRSS
jgi:hypothetical protein